MYYYRANGDANNGYVSVMNTGIVFTAASASDPSIRNFNGQKISFHSLSYEDFSSAMAGLLNTVLYPVGSLFFGTQVICPMSILIPNSTWQNTTVSPTIQVDSQTVNVWRRTA